MLPLWGAGWRAHGSFYIISYNCIYFEIITDNYNGRLSQNKKLKVGHKNTQWKGNKVHGKTYICKEQCEHWRLGKAQWAFCITVDSGRPFWRTLWLRSLEALRTRAFLACNGDPARDSVMTVSLRPQKPAGEEQEGGHTGRRGVLGRLNFPPTMLLHSFTISLIYSFIHSFVQQITSMSQTLHHAWEIK